MRCWGIYLNIFASVNEAIKAFRPVFPMAKSQWIRPAEGNGVKRLFSLNTFSAVERAYLHYVSSDPVHCIFNGKEANTTVVDAEVTALMDQAQT